MELCVKLFKPSSEHVKESAILKRNQRVLENVCTVSDSNIAILVQENEELCNRNELATSAPPSYHSLFPEGYDCEATTPCQDQPPPYFRT